MIDYVRNHFVRFGYESSDAEYLTEQLLKLQSSSSWEKWNSIVSDYENGVKKDFSAILKEARECGKAAEIHEYTADLLICVCMTRGAEKFYAEKGISTEIYENSFLDLKYKLEECKLVKGVIGTFVAFWFNRWFDLTRFAFGRLQFEIVEAECDHEKDGKTVKKGDKVINVHIPRTGTPLTPEECDKSFDRAAQFFKNDITSDVAFVCHSWLLYPPLVNELSDKMNTKKFAERFDILSSGDNGENNHGDAWRLFDHDYNGDPSSLDTSTGLRAAFVRLIMNTKKSGWGYGLYFYNK
jgi:hypothetical protein